MKATIEDDFAYRLGVGLIKFSIVRAIVSVIAGAVFSAKMR